MCRVDRECGFYAITHYGLVDKIDKEYLGSMKYTRVSASDLPLTSMHEFAPTHTHAHTLVARSVGSLAGR